MNKKLSVFFLTVILTFSFFTTAFAAPNLNFRLVNQTGFDLYEVYVSPGGDADWGEDIMDVDVVPNKSSVEITFAPKTKAKIWDLRVVAEDGSDAIWYDFDLSTISEITISMRNGTAFATWK